MSEGPPRSGQEALVATAWDHLAARHGAMVGPLVELGRLMVADGRVSRLAVATLERLVVDLAVGCSCCEGQACSLMTSGVCAPGGCDG